MPFQFDLSLTKSNLFYIGCVSFELPSLFIHYPIFNHFNPALYTVYYPEQQRNRCITM